MNRLKNSGISINSLPIKKLNMENLSNSCLNLPSSRLSHIFMDSQKDL
jgi:hypothetical protein